MRYRVSTETPWKFESSSPHHSPNSAKPDTDPAVTDRESIDGLSRDSTQTALSADGGLIRSARGVPAIRVLVCGGRNLDPIKVADWLCTLVDESEWGAPIIIHGGARGADDGARLAADRNGWTQFPFPADWKRHGRAAGPIRNAQMLREGKPDLVVALWDGKSRGTGGMIRLAKEAGVEVLIEPTDHLMPSRASSRGGES